MQKLVWSLESSVPQSDSLQRSSVYNFRQIIVYQRPGLLFKGDAVKKLPACFVVSENK